MAYSSDEHPMGTRPGDGFPPGGPCKDAGPSAVPGAEMHGTPRATLEYCRGCIERGEADASLLNDLGVLLKRLGRADDARRCFESALALDPAHVAALNNYGLDLLEAGKAEEAKRTFFQALRISPVSPSLLNNLGVALCGEGEYTAAIAYYREAMRLHPEYADAHWNLAQVLLLHGILGEGFEEYEWRWKKEDFPTPRREFPVPTWGGEDLRGRTILLHAEQGFGDTIQFLRFTGEVADRGGRVIVDVPRELCRLASTARGVHRVLEAGNPATAIDLHLPLMSLPRVLGTQLETIPADVPYLRPDPATAESWKARMRNCQRCVGVVWSGRRSQRENTKRSLAVDALRPLFEIPGVTWYSLDKKDGPGKHAVELAGVNVVDFTAELQDFADTAALMQYLDLVITVDTSVAHLAGALGKEVWTLLHYSSDWRWFRDRSDSPWYPTMTLFRQSRQGDWGSVISAVRTKLVSWLGGGGSHAEVPES